MSLKELEKIKLTEEEKNISEDEINELIKIINDDKNHYLENETIDTIKKDILRVLKFYKIMPPIKKMYENLLNNYRYVHDLTTLHKGRCVYVCNLKNGKFFYAGVVFNIEAREKGILVTTQTFNNVLLHYYFNTSVTFQYLTDSEKILLSMKELINEDTKEYEDEDEYEDEEDN